MTHPNYVTTNGATIPINIYTDSDDQKHPYELEIDRLEREEKLKIKLRRLKGMDK